MGMRICWVWLSLVKQELHVSHGSIRHFLVLPTGFPRGKMLLWHIESVLFSLHLKYLKQGNGEIFTSYNFHWRFSRGGGKGGAGCSARVCWWSTYQSSEEVPRWREVYWLTELSQAVLKFLPQVWLWRLCLSCGEILQDRAICWHDLPQFPLGGSQVHGGTYCSFFFPLCHVRIWTRLQLWDILVLTP